MRGSIVVPGSVDRVWEPNSSIEVNPCFVSPFNDVGRLGKIWDRTTRRRVTDKVTDFGIGGLVTAGTGRPSVQRNNVNASPEFSLPEYVSSSSSNSGTLCHPVVGYESSLTSPSPTSRSFTLLNKPRSLGHSVRLIYIPCAQERDTPP